MSFVEFQMYSPTLGIIAGRESFIELTCKFDSDAQQGDTADSLDLARPMQLALSLVDRQLHEPIGNASHSFLRPQIAIEYKDAVDGAELTYRTTDAKLVSALHKWFDARLCDHGTDAMAGHPNHHHDETKQPLRERQQPRLRRPSLAM